MHSLTYAFYRKINKAHGYCGPIRVDVPLRFLSIRIWVVLHRGTDWNGFALRFESLMGSEVFPLLVPGVLEERQNSKDVV